MVDESDYIRVLNFLKGGAWKFVPITDAKNSGRRLIKKIGIQ